MRIRHRNTTQQDTRGILSVHLSVYLRTFERRSTAADTLVQTKQIETE